jgi:hypothetical protein
MKNGEREQETHRSRGGHGKDGRVDGLDEGVTGNDVGSGEVVRVDVDNVLNDIGR